MIVLKHMLRDRLLRILNTYQDQTIRGKEQLQLGRRLEGVDGLDK